MSGRVGRDRFRRDDYHHQYHSSSSSSSSFSQMPQSSSRHRNPPSRHLWVGNLAPYVTESALTDHLLRFGELESVAFHPGRSYAFVNYVREDDAMAALNSLQGFILADMPLRVEFAKADKSSAPPRDENCLQRRDELQPANRSSAFSKRESRIRHASPDAYYPDSSRRTDNSTDHPSEILWIGYPSFLKVDDTILRKAFSPFGEIEKITAFPGRTYAFVQFRNLGSACRAKETLQGKLFGNPRVHICFARSDTASSSGGGRRSVGPNAPDSPHLKHNGRAASSDNFFPERVSRSGDPNIRPVHFSNMEYGDPEITNFSRKEHPWTCENGEERRFPEFGPDVGLPRGLHGYHNSPSRDGTGSAQFHAFSPQRFPRKSPFREDPWDLPEDINTYHGAKKLKTGSFPQEELPEYPLHNAGEGTHMFQRMLPDLPLSDETRPLPYKRIPDHQMNFNRPSGDMHDWRPSDDALQSSSPFSSTPVEWKRTTPELHQPAPKQEWKWEGTIAKGGTPVCRARCFPVGKVMDIFLPEFLDCTARTGLDMLAKHYYQAAASWVVFFVAASDADMGYYNEFMHYLGEKQRAAVSKLDERNTLFLVPPSEFSEKVLKVPGKLSISGVVLRLEPASPTVPTLPPAKEIKDTSQMYPYADTSYEKSDSPRGSFHSLKSFPNMGKPGICSPSLHGNVSTSAAPSFFPGYGHPSGSVPDQVENRHDLPGYVHASGSVSDRMENRHDFRPAQRSSTLGPTWSPHPPQTSVPSSRELPFQAFPTTQVNHHPVSGSSGLEPNMADYNSGYSGMSYPGGNKSSLHEQKYPASVPLDRLPSHLGPQGQSISSSSVSMTEDFRTSSMMGNQPENPSKVTPRYTAPETNQLVSDLSTSQFRQPQLPMQAEIMQGLSHAAAAAGSRGTQEVLNMGSAQDEGEGDPQKRLQATLQLAAALLQQIQQGKGT